MPQPQTRSVAQQGRKRLHTVAAVLFALAFAILLAMVSGGLDWLGLLPLVACAMAGTAVLVKARLARPPPSAGVDPDSGELRAIRATRLAALLSLEDEPITVAQAAARIGWTEEAVIDGARAARGGRHHRRGVHRPQAAPAGLTFLSTRASAGRRRRGRV